MIGQLTATKGGYNQGIFITINKYRILKEKHLCKLHRNERRKIKYEMQTRYALSYSISAVAKLPCHKRRNLL